MNKKGNTLIIILAVLLVLIIIVIAYFVIRGVVKDNNKELFEWSWFMKAELENGSSTDADVVVSYAGLSEYGARSFYVLKEDKIKKDIWTEIKIYQDCSYGSYLCAWLLKDKVSYMKLYCFPINGTLVVNNQPKEVCLYPRENINGELKNQTHDILTLPAICSLRLNSYNLEDKKYILYCDEGSWKDTTICLDYNIGIVTANLKNRIEMNQSEKDYYKLNNNKCYKFNSLSNNNITFEIEYEGLSDDINSVITLTILDKDRDPDNIRDGLYYDYFGINGDDLGGKNYVFVLK